MFQNEIQTLASLRLFYDVEKLKPIIESANTNPQL